MKYHLAHFPAGTIVEIFVEHVTEEPEQYEVSSIRCNGYNSWVLQTTTKDDLTEWKAFNMCYVTRIIKRGSGSYKVTENFPRAKVESILPKPKNSYAFYSPFETVMTVAKQFLNDSMLVDSEKLIGMLIDQGVIRSFDSWSPQTANKKKLKKAIRRVLNKCLENRKKAQEEIWKRKRRSVFQRARS